eukprot:TRINITY_DN6176_c0_g1_i1.p2 TRINITY_DN6176_c0_g1~~TRINITY_DN6176_c0_g1_i1.p2  ORF type:complete len:127 (-),score=23.73 TRINITY_DN6176_c0_g1_i1:81-461(-)
MCIRDRYMGIIRQFRYKNYFRRQMKLLWFVALVLVIFGFAQAVEYDKQKCKEAWADYVKTQNEVSVSMYTGHARGPEWEVLRKKLENVRQTFLVVCPQGVNLQEYLQRDQGLLILVLFNSIFMFSV